MTKTLYTFPKNPQADKVLIAAEYAGVKVECAKDFVYGVTNHSIEYLAKFSLGTVPAYEDGSVKLTSGNAIAAYVGGAAFAGATPALQAEVTQYVTFADHHITPAACTWTYPIYGFVNGPKKPTPKTEEAVKNVLAVLERVLTTRTFLVGNAVTLADVSVALSLLPLYRDVLTADFRAPYVNVHRYLSTLFAQKEFISVIGNVTFCVTPITPVAKQKGDNKKENKKDNKKKDKKEDKKSAPAKKKNSEPTAAELEKAREECEKKAAKEAKNRSTRVDGLPKSPFVLDEWKRFYSNNEEKDSMKWLDEHFDAEGWSMWLCDYDYNEELTRTFMSSNLIGGFFQRCDKLRKYTFASMAVFGDDQKSRVQGVWLMRGQDVLFEELGYTIDSPQYSFKKLDFSNAADKKIVHESFSWAGDFEHLKPLPFNCGKIYK